MPQEKQSFSSCCNSWSVEQTQLLYSCSLSESLQVWQTELTCRKCICCTFSQLFNLFSVLRRCNLICNRTSSLSLINFQVFALFHSSCFLFLPANLFEFHLCQTLPASEESYRVTSRYVYLVKSCVKCPKKRFKLPHLEETLGLFFLLHSHKVSSSPRANCTSSKLSCLKFCCSKPKLHVSKDSVT